MIRMLSTLTSSSSSSGIAAAAVVPVVGAASESMRTTLRLERLLVLVEAARAIPTAEVAASRAFSKPSESSLTVL